MRLAIGRKLPRLAALPIPSRPPPTRVCGLPTSPRNARVLFLWQETPPFPAWNRVGGSSNAPAA